MTLVGGVVLEQSGDADRRALGHDRSPVGATVLAAATALPEVSTGLQAVRMGDYQLALSDIFGGNAFLPVLFLLASAALGLSRAAAGPEHRHLPDALGVLLTAVYIYGLIFRPRRMIMRMGLDSFTVLVLYALGIAGLVAIARS